MTGWLKKEAEKGLKVGNLIKKPFHDRWFVLDNNELRLNYYEKKESDSVKGFLDLAKIVRLEKTGRGNFEFVVETKEDNGTAKTFTLQAPAAAQLELWLKAIGIVRDVAKRKANAKSNATPSNATSSSTATTQATSPNVDSTGAKDLKTPESPRNSTLRATPAPSSQNNSEKILGAQRASSPATAPSSADTTKRNRITSRVARWEGSDRIPPRWSGSTEPIASAPPTSENTNISPRDSSSSLSTSTGALNEPEKSDEDVEKALESMISEIDLQAAGEIIKSSLQTSASSIDPEIVNETLNDIVAALGGDSSHSAPPDLSPDVDDTETPAFVDTSPPPTIEDEDLPSRSGSKRDSLPTIVPDASSDVQSRYFQAAQTLPVPQPKEITTSAAPSSVKSPRRTSTSSNSATTSSNLPTKASTPGIAGNNKNKQKEAPMTTSTHNPTPKETQNAKTSSSSKSTTSQSSPSGPSPPSSTASSPKKISARPVSMWTSKTPSSPASSPDPIKTSRMSVYAFPTPSTTSSTTTTTEKTATEPRKSAPDPIITETFKIGNDKEIVLQSSLSSLAPQPIGQLLLSEPSAVEMSSPLIKSNGSSGEKDELRISSALSNTKRHGPSVPSPLVLLEQDILRSYEHQINSTSNRQSDTEGEESEIKSVETPDAFIAVLKQAIANPATEVTLKLGSKTLLGLNGTWVAQDARGVVLEAENDLDADFDPETCYTWHLPGFLRVRWYSHNSWSVVPREANPADEIKWNMIGVGKLLEGFSTFLPASRRALLYHLYNTVHTILQETSFMRSSYEIPLEQKSENLLSAQSEILVRRDLCTRLAGVLLDGFNDWSIFRKYHIFDFIRDAATDKTNLPFSGVDVFQLPLLIADVEATSEDPNVRFRNFVVGALNHKMLYTWMAYLFKNLPQVTDYYDDESLVRQLPAVILNSLAPLSELPFHIAMERPKRAKKETDDAY